MKTKRYYGHDDQQEPTIMYDVLRLIQRRPGIDTPAVCVELHRADLQEDYGDNMTGYNLANFLSEWYPEQWDKTCKSVDLLLERGQISFSDDGELCATGQDA